MLFKSRSSWRRNCDWLPALEQAKDVQQRGADIYEVREELPIKDITVCEPAEADIPNVFRVGVGTSADQCWQLAVGDSLELEKWVATIREYMPRGGDPRRRGMQERGGK